MLTHWTSPSCVGFYSQPPNTRRTWIPSRKWNARRWSWLQRFTSSQLQPSSKSPAPRACSKHRRNCSWKMWQLRIDFWEVNLFDITALVAIPCYILLYFFLNIMLSISMWYMGTSWIVLDGLHVDFLRPLQSIPVTPCFNWDPCPGHWPLLLAPQVLDSPWRRDVDVTVRHFLSLLPGKNIRCTWGLGPGLVQKCVCLKIG